MTDAVTPMQNPTTPPKPQNPYEHDNRDWQSYFDVWAEAEYALDRWWRSDRDAAVVAARREGRRSGLDEAVEIVRKLDESSDAGVYASDIISELRVASRSAPPDDDVS